MQAISRLLPTLVAGFLVGSTFAADYSRTGTGNWTDAVWTMNGTANQTWADGNSASLTFAADGTLTLDANASATGLTVSGLASDQTANLAGGSTLTLSDGATLSVASGTLNATNRFAGTFTKTGEGTLAIGTAQSAFGGITVQEGTLKTTSGGFGTPCLDGTPVTVLSGAQLLIAADFGIGSGRVTLDGANIHITGTQQYLQTLTLKNGASITATNGTSGGNDFNSFRVGYGYRGVDAALSVEGTSASAIDAGVTMVRGGDGNWTVNVASTGDASGVDLTINGRIFDYAYNEGQVLKKTGAGTLKLTNNSNSWIGGINLTAGTIQLAANRAAGSGVITTADGTSLVLAEGVTARVKSLSGPVSLSALGTGATLVLGEGVTDATSELTFSGTIGPTVTLQKNGADTLILTREQDASFAGLIVNGGTLRLDEGGSYGASALKTTPITINAGARLEVLQSFGISGSPVTLDGGTLHVTGQQLYLNALTLKNGASITASTTSSDHADGNSFRVGNNYGTGANPTLTVSGTSGSSIAADIVLTAHGSSVFNATVDSTGDASGVDLTISGQIRDYDHLTSVSIPIKKMGAGTVRLTNGTNRWTTGMEVTEGTVQISKTQALGLGQLNLNGTGTKLQLLSTANGGDGTYRLKQLTGSGTVSALGTSATLQVGSVKAADGTTILSGDSSFAGTIAAEVAFEKIGTGKLTLNRTGGNGANPASVSVTEGTLSLQATGIGPTSHRYGYFGSTTVQVSGNGRLETGSWNIQGTPIVVTGEDAELVLTGNNYANNVTLADGADISGVGREYRVGWWTADPPVLNVTGTGSGSVLSTGYFMLLKDDAKTLTNVTLNVADTGASAFGNPDLLITSQIIDHDGYEGLQILKTGAGTLEITNTASTWAGGIRVKEGTLLYVPGALGKGALTVDSGAVTGYLPTSSPTYADLNPSSMAKGSALEILINSPEEFSRFNLTALPDFDEENGFLKIQVSDAAEIGTDELFAISTQIPDVPAADLDLEDWLMTDFRSGWNLNWNAANSVLMLSRDASAVPEPAAWVLLILGVCALGFGRRARQIR